MGENGQVKRLQRVRRLARLGTARVIREEAGITVRELADSIGTSPTNLSRWERGKVTPGTRLALRWAAALDELEGRA